jgi:hypothetical protein
LELHATLPTHDNQIVEFHYLLASLKFYAKRLGIRGVATAAKAKLSGKIQLHEVLRTGYHHKLYLRIPSSDVETFIVK